MIHNKYYEILKQFLGDYKREVYGRELIGKVKLSQKGIALALEELEEQSILKSRKQGTLKYYRLNIELAEIKDILAQTEFARKLEFLAKHRVLAHLFKADDRIIGIFGSYAKGREKKDSDIDILVIGKKKANDYGYQGKLLDLNVSPKYFTQAEWKKLLKEKNNLVVEIINHHILIFGIEQFIDTLWREYYGVS